MMPAGWCWDENLQEAKFKMDEVAEVIDYLGPDGGVWQDWPDG